MLFHTRVGQDIQSRIESLIVDKFGVLHVSLNWYMVGSFYKQVYQLNWIFVQAMILDLCEWCVDAFEFSDIFRSTSAKW